MIEITRQLTGLAKKITTIADTIEVLEWARAQEGLYCTVAAQTGGTWLIEVGGVTVSSVQVELGQWVVFDGERFYALTQEEFDAKGYTSEGQ